MRELERLEIDVAKSCNLSCAACNHLSPLYRKGFVNAGELAADLKVLAKVVRVKTIRLLGGEPLLHSGIIDLLRIARESGIAQRVSVVTNGVLLPRMSPTFWELVDVADVSLYPGIQVEMEKLEPHKSKISVRPCPTFYETFSVHKNNDERLVSKIVDSCKIVNFCVGIVDRTFYKCMRAAYITEKVPHPSIFPGCDGIKIQPDGFDLQFDVYMSTSRPLAACAFCTGSSGKRFDHAQLPQISWLDRQARPIKEMLKENFIMGP